MIERDTGERGREGERESERARERVRVREGKRVRGVRRECMSESISSCGLEYEYWVLGSTL